MQNKMVYQVSAKQLLVLAFASAMIAIGATAALYNLGPAAEVVNLASNDNPIEPASSGISDPNSVNDETNSIEVYRTIAPGVAFINTTSYRQNWWGEVQEGRGNGSGSVIDANGHILTNYHVIEGAQQMTVSFGGERTFPAKLVGGDPDTDLAVIKIDPFPGMRVVDLGDSDKLVVGQKVLAIGNPFGLDRTLTTGVISGLQRPIRARNDRPIDAAIQTDASINPGNSGGPLLDKYGKMIGINSQILSPQGGSVGVGFAVPANTAKRVIPQLIQFGEVRRPKLGATLPEVSMLLERGYRLPVQHGLVVYQMQRGGSAEQAGLRGVGANGALGDIILSVDGQKMTSMDDLFRVLDRKEIGQTVNVEVFRDGKTETLPVKLLAQPANATPSRRIQ